MLKNTYGFDCSCLRCQCQAKEKPEGVNVNQLYAVDGFLDTAADSEGLCERVIKEVNTCHSLMQSRPATAPIVSSKLLALKAAGPRLKPFHPCSAALMQSYVATCQASILALESVQKKLGEAVRANDLPAQKRAVQDIYSTGVCASGFGLLAVGCIIFYTKTTQCEMADVCINIARAVKKLALLPQFSRVPKFTDPQSPEEYIMALRMLASVALKPAASSPSDTETDKHKSEGKDADSDSKTSPPFHFHSHKMIAVVMDEALRACATHWKPGDGLARPIFNFAAEIYKSCRDKDITPLWEKY